MDYLLYSYTILAVIDERLKKARIPFYGSYSETDPGPYFESWPAAMTLASLSMQSLALKTLVS